MDREIWDDRRKGLEEEFFARHNRELIDKIRAKEAKDQARRELAVMTGIQNEEVLNNLIDVGVTPSTMIALAMVPLVLVAWSDQILEPEEVNAILNAAEDQGIVPESPSYELLVSWLNKIPGPHLFNSWESYIKSLREVMDPAAFKTLGTELMERTRKVAQAAGGFLGLGNKISDSEKREIQRLSDVFK